MSLAIASRPLRVLMLASELAPFAKVGGLADMVASLAPSLQELGIEVRVVVPLYASIDRALYGLEPDPEVPRLGVRLGGERVEARFFRGMDPSSAFPVHFVACDRYFDRPGIYDDPETGEGYPDNAERFIFFGRAAEELVRALGWRPDVVHCHDHQTAPVVADLRLRLAWDPFFAGVASVFTIHNLGYQGIFPPTILPLLAVGSDQFYPMSPFEFYGDVNFMKAGIVHADLLTTVSRRYAEEICDSAEHGQRLEGVLRERAWDLVGILNGIDDSVWDPSSDRLIPSRYGPDNLGGKVHNRNALRDRFQLAAMPARTPVVGMISRLVEQKGLDLIERSLDDLMRMDLQLAVLGTGQERYERMLEDAARRYPGRIGVALGFDDALAHLVEAGADMFLMPSRYEPCGLNQLYSLRYGTVPVVRATGGLADTVTDEDAHPGAGTGYTFGPYEATAMLGAVGRARRAFEEAPRWEALMLRGMRQDFSWKQSARQYVDVYEHAAELGQKRIRAATGKGAKSMR
jgi:starch synthase